MMHTLLQKTQLHNQHPYFKFPVGSDIATLTINLTFQKKTLEEGSALREKEE